MKRDIFKKLNYLVTIDSKKTEIDDIGGQIISWEFFEKTWAGFSKINHLGPQMRSNNFSTDYYKFIVRAQCNATVGMRIAWDKRKFYIQSVAPHKNSYYKEIITYEKVANEFRA